MKSPEHRCHILRKEVNNQTLFSERTHKMYLEEKMEKLKSDCFNYHMHDKYEDCYNITWINNETINQANNPFTSTTTQNETLISGNCVGVMFNGTKDSEQIMVNETKTIMTNETIFMKYDNNIEMINIINSTSITNKNDKIKKMIITNIKIIKDVKKILPNQKNPIQNRLIETTTTRIEEEEID